MWGLDPVTPVDPGFVDHREFAVNIYNFTILLFYYSFNLILSLRSFLSPDRQSLIVYNCKTRSMLIL